MKRRIFRKAMAFLILMSMTFGVFDGIPFVKDNLSNTTVSMAASAYDAKVNSFILNPKFRNGTVWGGGKTPENKQAGTGYGCNAYARDFTMYVFGKTLTSGQIFYNVNEIRAGDAIFAHPGSGKCPVAITDNCKRSPTDHWFIVLYRDGNQLYTAEGNYAGRVRVMKYGYRIEGDHLVQIGSNNPFTIKKGHHFNSSNVTPTVTYTNTTGNASNISNNNATISGSMSPACNVSSWGFYISTNNANFVQCPVSKTTVASNSMKCNVGSYYKLNFGTTYYYKTYAVVNGKTIIGGVKSFKTTATKPEIPTPKITQDNANIGLETSASIYWSGVANASYYKAYLYDEEHKLIHTSGNVTGTKYAFPAATKEGKYYASIESYNEVGTKGKSSEVSFTVHPDVTITYMDADSFVDEPDDYEPAVLGIEKVHYGKNAPTPCNPSHTGYTFKGWSNTSNAVKDNMIIKAEYTLNKYTVTYVDSLTGKTLGIEKVDYYSSAKPVDFEVPTGYVKTGFDGWDREYKQITEDTKLNTSIGWYNDNFPIYAEILSAVREYDAEESDNEGYTIQAKVTNWSNSSTKGRVIVALKTKAGKLLTSTESSAFSVKKSANKTIEVFVPYDKAASVAEVYVVGQYKDAVPITTTASNNATLEIDQSNVMTNWSTEQPPASATKKESRTEYRYSDKETKTSTATSLAGYNLESSRWVYQNGGTIDYVSSFSPGFNTSHWTYTNYNKKPVTPSETATKKVTVSTSTVGYLYYHWCRGENLAAPTNRLVDGWKTSTRGTFHAFTCGGLGWDSKAKAYYGNLPAQCKDTYWWIGNGEGVAANMPILRCAYSNYTKEFTYARWKDFTDWSTNAVTATGTRKVETRTVHRYLSDEMMQEDTSGKERTVSGTVDKKFAGKEATLFIYKVDEASDFTNEYVAQTKIDEDGKYSFTFKLREEPSEKTGDMTIVLGIEGNSTAIYLDTIKAPKKQCKVRFFDYEGNVIASDTVDEGGSVELPDSQKLKRTGYTFERWTATNINITEDTDFYPEYSLNKYDVVFVDWKANTVQVKQFDYGSRLTTPIAEEPDESQIVEWDKLADGIDTVTENMVVCTRYKTKEFNVTVHDIDGSVLEEKTVKYGTALTLPTIDEQKNNCYFYGWKNVKDGNKSYTDTLVKQELDLYPDYVYKDTVENPVASIASGQYTKEQVISLSTATKNASIYYTLDGSDPSSVSGILYTSPIKIEDATVLRFVAKAKAHNDSEIIDNYYVINYNGARSNWMLYSELPKEVKDSQASYNIYSDKGYAYRENKKVSLLDESKALENAGWEKESESWSEYSDWANEPFRNDSTYIDVDIDTEDIYSVATQYKYSHYKYEEDGQTLYSDSEVEGKDCELETIELDNSMAIAGFLDDGKLYYIRDGVNWYNQTKVTGKTKAGEKYRYRYKTVNYQKWSDYSVEPPKEDETREVKEETVFSYERHNKYIVNIYGTNGSCETQIVEEGNKADKEKISTIDGFSVEGYYTDEDLTKQWNIDEDTVNKSMNLYTMFRLKKYNVKFVDYNGDEIVSKEVQYMDETTAPKATDVEGMKFVGWDTSDYQYVTKNMSVKAKYIPESEYATVIFDKNKITSEKNKTIQIGYEITPISQSDELIDWESSDNSVAIVSDQGIVTTISAGTAEITATIQKTGAVAKCTIVVVEDSNASETKPTTSTNSNSTITKPSVSTTTGKEINKATNSTTTSLKSVEKIAVESAKKSLKLTWKKVTGASGYEIQYSLKNNFKKTKKITIKKATTKSKTIKGLKKKKKYYVRIRAYMKSGKTKIYSAWTKTSKKIK